MNGPARFLVVAIDENGHGRPHFCADEVAVHAQVKAMVFPTIPTESLDEAAQDQVRWVYGELLADGVARDDGEPTMYLFRLGDHADKNLAELERLRTLINTPHTADWLQAVELEAAHQVERWGSEHDAGKEPPDWFWLLGYLAGKALAALLTGNRQKGLHHIVSSGAALLNWHRAVTGVNTAMRPGIEEPQEPAR